MYPLGHMVSLTSSTLTRRSMRIALALKAMMVVPAGSDPPESATRSSLVYSRLYMKTISNTPPDLTRGCGLYLLANIFERQALIHIEE